MDDELERSIARGSVYTWWVAERYEILDDVVVPVGEPNDRWHHYAPFAFPELPVEFAKLVSSDESAVLKFIHKWGLLGRSQLLPFDTPDPREALRRRGRHSGDPLDWIMNHAKTVETVLYLLDRRQECKRQEEPKILWDGIKEAIRRYAIPGALAGIEYAKGSFHDPETYFIMGDPNNPEEIVARLFKAVLEPNIQYLQESLLIQDDYTIIRSKLFPAMLPVIYSHLADAVAGERSYIKCSFEECGNYFLQTDVRQRYCPHPVNPKGESLCSIKSRKRRLQNRMANNGKKVNETVVRRSV